MQSREDKDAKTLLIATALLVFGSTLAGCSLLLGLARWLGADGTDGWFTVVVAVAVFAAVLFLLRRRGR